MVASKFDFFSTQLCKPRINVQKNVIFKPVATNFQMNSIKNIYFQTGPEEKLGKPAARVPEPAAADRHRAEDDPQGQAGKRPEGAGEGHSDDREQPVHLRV